MGMMRFQIPPGLSPEAIETLKCAFRTGDYDQSPQPTETLIEDPFLAIRGNRDESSKIQLLWKVDGIGELLNTTSTLVEREKPYDLIVELTRGKLNIVRNQTSDWRLSGLDDSPLLRSLIQEATRSFGIALLDEIDLKPSQAAQESLNLSHQAADELMNCYIQQVFALRHEELAKLDTAIGCRLTKVPPESHQKPFIDTFNTVSIPMNWKQIEPNETEYSWTETDALIDWATQNHLKITAGPTIDFAPGKLPDWLSLWKNDPMTISSFMCDYVETVVSRYRHKIRRWVISTGSNCYLTLGLREEDCIRLTARLAQAAWGIDPSLEVVIGIAQPWGEYMISGEKLYSPFNFADTLLRGGLDLAGFELEWMMGVSPDGSYCRDSLECSRLLDLFGVLGVPLQLSLGYPHSTSENPNPAEPIKNMGFYHTGFNPLSQQIWTEKIGSTALCKSHVNGFYWNHFIDGPDAQSPKTGLVDANGAILPALETIRQFRSLHFK